MSILKASITAFSRSVVVGLCAMAGLGLWASKLEAAVIIIDTSAGYDAPPSVLGGYTMAPMARSLGASGSPVSSASDLGLTINFGQQVAQVGIGTGWSSWSHGYTGTVWHTANSSSAIEKDSLTLTLPTGTKAFYFYVMPAEVGGAYNMTVAAPGGGSVTKEVQPTVGAYFFGLYSINNSNLTTVTISRPSGSAGFAFGEFGIFNDGVSGGAVPEPTSMAIFGLSGLALIARRKMSKTRSVG